MVAFHAKLSHRSVHMRYLAGISYTQRTAHERLTRACAIDYDREMALIAEVLDEGSTRGDIVGVGRLVRGMDASSGEFALVVIDDFQKRGIGAELLRRLIRVAREEKLETIEGWIAPSNLAMQNLSRKLGFNVRFNSSEELVQATLTLSESQTK